MPRRKRQCLTLKAENRRRQQDRVAQDQTQQLAARHRHAALEHARVAQLGEAEHVAACHRHAAQAY